MTILDEILAHKRGEVAKARQALSAGELASRAEAVTEPTRGFRAALLEAERPRVIAEIKRRSPSRGEIRPDFEPVDCASAKFDLTLILLERDGPLSGVIEYSQELFQPATIARLASSFETQPALDLVDVGDLGADDVIRASGDFDGDGAAELLVQDGASGALSVWSLVAGAEPAVADLGLAPAAGQDVAGGRDYDGDGDDDLLIQGVDGSLTVWLMTAGRVDAVAPVSAPAGGEVLASGDFDGDRVADVARRGASGNVELLLLGAGLDAPVRVAAADDASALELIGAGDYDGDGRADLLWMAPGGDLAVWFLDPGLVFETGAIGNGGSWIPLADWR